MTVRPSSSGLAGGGVGAGVDFGEFVDTDPSVDLGGFESGVAEQLGDVADVGTTFEHPRRRGVTQEVAGAGFAGAGMDIGADRTREPVERQRPPGRAHEQDARIGVGDEVGSGVGEIRIDPAGRTGAERHAPVAGTFPMPDEQRRPRPVDVMHRDVGEFSVAFLGCAIRACARYSNPNSQPLDRHPAKWGLNGVPTHFLVPLKRANDPHPNA